MKRSYRRKKLIGTSQPHVTTAAACAAALGLLYPLVSEEVVSTWNENERWEAYRWATHEWFDRLAEVRTKQAAPDHVWDAVSDGLDGEAA